MFHKRSAGFTIVDFLLAVAIVVFVASAIFSVLDATMDRNTARALKQWTDITAPGPLDITPAQRELIRTPVTNKLNELEIQLGRCNADLQATTADAQRRVQNAKNAHPQNSAEADAALSELANAEQALRRQQNMPPCRNDALDNLRKVARAYRVLPTAEATK